MSGQYVVILTGGALPQDASRADPPRHQLDLAVERGSAVERHIAEEGWLLGYAEAAKLHRAVAAWVLGDEDEAKRFAAFVTREIDPAYVTAGRSPLGEMLSGDDERRHPTPQDGVPF